MKIPFDIKYRPQIESGEYKVETGDKKRVRIICWNRKVNDFPIVALAYDAQRDIEIFINASVLGEPKTDIASERLFIITPEPELSEFEKAIKRAFICAGRDSVSNDIIKDTAAELLELAKDEIYSHESLVEYAEKSRAEGKAEALSARATVLTENLAKSRLDKDSIPYYIIEFMCNLYTCRKWKEIEDTAELYATRIKDAALKDLPRWRTIEEATTIRTNENDCITTESMLVKGWMNRNDYRVIGSGCMVNRKMLCVPVVELEKLPGFKED